MTSASQSSARSHLDDLSDLELAQALAQRLAIQPKDWHRLNRDRTVRAQEQIGAALVYLLSGSPEEAEARLKQAIGWLDRSLSAPPCPTHGHRKQPGAPRATEKG